MADSTPAVVALAVAADVCWLSTDLFWADHSSAASGADSLVGWVPHEEAPVALQTAEHSIVPAVCSPEPPLCFAVVVQVSAWCSSGQSCTVGSDLDCGFGLGHRPVAAGPMSP